MTTKHWERHFRWGRLEVGIDLYRHRCPFESERWVVQPYIIWDRKDD